MCLLRLLQCEWNRARSSACLPPVQHPITAHAPILPPIPTHPTDAPPPLTAHPHPHAHARRTGDARGLGPIDAIGNPTEVRDRQPIQLETLVLAVRAAGTIKLELEKIEADDDCVHDPEGGEDTDELPHPSEVPVEGRERGGDIYIYI